MTKVVNAFGNPNIEMIIDPIPYTRLRLLFIVYGFDRHIPVRERDIELKQCSGPRLFRSNPNCTFLNI